MGIIHKLNNLFRPARLSRRRLIFAVTIALVADGLQIPFQAVPPVPEIIDVVAALLTICLLGFHVLLLPTFMLEFIHFVDMLPTWTGCVVAVIALRRSEKPNALPPLENVAEPGRVAVPPPLPSPPGSKNEPPASA